MATSKKQVVKKVVSHLKKDTKEFREQIADDKKLSKQLKKSVSKKK